MSTPLSTHILTQAIESLAEKDSLKGLFHEHRDGFPLPSGTMLEEIVQLARSILFPGLPPEFLPRSLSRDCFR